MLTCYFIAADTAYAVYLGGTLDYTTRETRIRQNNTLSTNDSQSFRLSLRNNGAIFHPKIGNYGLHTSLVRENRNFNNVTGDIRYRINDYSVSANLLPKLSPISLYAQKISRESGKVVGANLNTETTTYNLSWTIPFKKLPRLRVNLYQTSLDDNSGTGATGGKVSQERVSRSMSIESDGKWNETRLLTRYQLSSLDIAGEGRSETNSINISANSRLSDRISLRGYFNTQAGDSSLGGSAQPGVEFFRENSFGSTLAYSKDRLIRADLSYDFYRNPFSSFTSFRRHSVQGNLNLHPTFQLDISSNFRFLLSNSVNTKTISYNESLGLSYRPMFGMSTGGAFAIGTSDTTGDIEANTFSHTYNYFITYIKSLRKIRLNTGYNLSIGRQSTNPSDVESTDIITTLHAGVDNTQTNIVHLAANYAINDTRRKSSLAVVDENRTENRLSLSANSNYFKSILLRGDSLRLQSNAGLTNGSGFGVEGNIITFEAKASYYVIRGIILTSGLNWRDYPSKIQEDRRTYFGEMQWFRYIWRYVNFNLRLRQGIEDNRFSTDRRQFEGSSILSWMIGSTSFNLEYRRSRERRGSSVTKNESSYLRITRSFSLLG